MHLLFHMSADVKPKNKSLNSEQQTKADIKQTAQWIVISNPATHILDVQAPTQRFLQNMSKTI